MDTKLRGLLEALATETVRADAEWKRAHDVRRRLEEATRRADEAERRAKQAEHLARLAAERAQAATKRANDYGLIISGEYYSPLEHVWVIDTAEYGDESLFEALRREKVPTFVEGRPRPQPAETHTATLKKAKTTPLYRPAADGSSSVDGTAEQARWPTNIYGEPELASPMAHLVPLSYEYASMYSDVARCVLGLRDNARINIQKAIHGTQHRRGQARIPDTGIKYCQYNQIRLPSMELFFDVLPCVVIVPIMTLEQKKAWNLDEGFESIVLAGAFFKTPAKRAYKGIQIPLTTTLATSREIETSLTDNLCMLILFTLSSFDKCSVLAILALQIATSDIQVRQDVGNLASVNAAR
jgi:hypothetical protein